MLEMPRDAVELASLDIVRIWLSPQTTSSSWTCSEQEIGLGNSLVNLPN